LPSVSVPTRTVKYDGTPSKLVQSLPWYKHVPKDPHKQAQFRRNVRNRCLHDVKFREKIMDACKQDPLFFFNCFLYLVEPRESEVRLFDTWPHQDIVIAEMADGWGKRPFKGKKSREQGATWIMAALFVWAFTFLRTQHLAFASKDDETADDPGNMSSFGAKIDFLLERLPEWMRPEYKRSASDHTWIQSKNKRAVKNGNFIKGFSATAGIARGGRFTVVFCDEKAFWKDGADYDANACLIYVTNCQIDWSTPNGQGNAFYDDIHGDNDATLLVLDFLDNPVHGKGKYTTTAGQLEILDGEMIEGHEYVTDGLVRTPWADARWRRHGRDNLWLARELYMDFGGSTSRPFPQAALDRAMTQCQNPHETGMLLFDYTDPANQKALQWVTGPGFKFDLWRPVDAWGRVSVARPVVGADIALGNSGDKSSNSVLSLWDAATWEQVGELAINSLGPTEFARLAVAVCWWLSPTGQTFFIWEKNGGAGTTFTDEMMLLSYPNMYYEDAQSEQQRWTKLKTDRPGYHTARLSRTLTPLVSALARGDAVFRSRSLVAECGEYEISETGKWVHPRSVNTRDSAASGEGHGDRAVAAAVAFHAMRERKSLIASKTATSAPRNSLLGRMRAHKEQVRQQARRLSRW
jgi:hypothetical protein